MRVRFRAVTLQVLNMRLQVLNIRLSSTQDHMLLLLQHRKKLLTEPSYICKAFIMEFTLHTGRHKPEHHCLGLSTPDAYATH